MRKNRRKCTETGRKVERMKGRKDSSSSLPLVVSSSRVSLLRYTHTLLFLPLIIAAGRLATRVVLNLWNMIEG